MERPAGTLQIAMNDQLDQFITMPYDATAAHLEMLFVSRADIFGRLLRTRSQEDQGYTWSVTFSDYAGPVPLLQRVGGVTGRTATLPSRTHDLPGRDRTAACGQRVSVY